MRDSTEIKLDQLIVHIINSRQTNGLILSERCIPLDRAGDLTQRLIDYFIEHIENSLKDSATKAARFKTETFNDDKGVPQICRAVLHGGLDLVIGSQEVTKCLKNIIDKLQKLLSSSIEDLEKNLWKDEADRKIILLIPEHEIYLNGSYLSILGGKKLQNLSNTLREKVPNQESIKSMYDKCQDIVRWKGIDIKSLTPLHFRVQGELAQNDPIARTIDLLHKSFSLPLKRGVGGDQMTLLQEV